MLEATVTGLTAKLIKLEFDVQVSKPCWDFFKLNGYTLLFLSGWSIDDFEVVDDETTINIGVTGQHELNWR